MWPVDEFSTRFLMVELYCQYLGGAAVAAALQRVQRRLSEANAAELRLAEAYRQAWES